MPNWCDNVLVLKGYAKDLKAFDEQFKGIRKTINISDKSEYIYVLQEEIDTLDLKDKYIFIKKRNSLDRYDGYKVVEAEGYSYENFIPMPQGSQLANYVLDWHSWRMNNWGVKWDISDDVYLNGMEEIDAVLDNKRDKKREIVYSFLTPWEEPFLVVSAMASQYPEIDFRHEFVEEGCQLAGYREYFKGDLIKTALASPNTIEEFLIKEFDYEFYQCNACGAYVNEGYIETNDDGDEYCPYCDEINTISKDIATL